MPHNKHHNLISQNLISIDHCDFGYGDSVILKDVSLDIHEGEFIAVVGPNGAGKTTLVKTLLGLTNLLRGNINSLIKTKEIGYVPQHVQLNLNTPITVGEFFDLKRTANTHLKKRLSELLELEKNLTTPLAELSTGQLQRALVAFALMSAPKLIILDEATDGLDFKAQSSFFTLMREFQTQSGSTVMMVSHDITAVGSYATRVICLNNTLLYDGSPKSPEFHSCLHSIYGKDSVIHHHTHEDH